MGAADPCYDDIWVEAYGDMQDVGPVHRHMRRLLGRVLRDVDYKTVLDVGCGAGHNLPLLAGGRSLTRVTGVDISEEALRGARQRGGAELRQLDIQHDRIDDRWDLVFSSLVLEHLPDDESALANMKSMAGSHVVVSTIAGDYERYEPWEKQMGHVRNYRRGELEEKMQAVGLRVERAIYWGFPFYTPIARRLQNRMKAEPSYGPATRMLARLMWLAYFANSSRRGDLLIVVATV